VSGHVFHPGHDELHGITVVVETSGPETYVGRFDRQDDHSAYLKDVGVHRAGDDVEEWPEYLGRTIKFGVKVEHRQLVVPTGDITQILRLSDVVEG
jgi:hypothetical protein